MPLSKGPLSYCRNLNPVLKSPLVGRAQITSEKTGTVVLTVEAGINNFTSSPLLRETAAVRPNPSSLISKQVPFW